MIESLAMLQGKYGMLQDELSSFQVSMVILGSVTSFHAVELAEFSFLSIFLFESSCLNQM
ncbi:hypothetical protein Syun_027151 [Stephania yunnanensis]|uniref:Uncharacterized protein n=1 Tax=Stephania yunnanensis TaxID=152371 RepID=A0AAP0EHF3_9MAGN